MLFQFLFILNVIGLNKMNREEIINLLIKQIKSCHEQLTSARNRTPINKLYIEGFRCRLDELILLYHLIRNISFVEACKELNIDYMDVSVELKD